MIRSEIVTPVVPAVTKIAAAIALPEVRLVVFATRGLGWIIAPVCPTSLIDFRNGYLLIERHASVTHIYCVVRRCRGDSCLYGRVLGWTAHDDSCVADYSGRPKQHGRAGSQKQKSFAQVLRRNAHSMLLVLSRQ